MRETDKTNAYRTAEFFSTYLRGAVIDIGCGDDAVTASAERFDRPNGDANEILRYRRAESFDCVYSSHCLEHMNDPWSALVQWWRLLRPGGYMVLVVPHEDLYEQGYWPSLFNREHKATFRIGARTSWSPVSVDIHCLVAALPGSEIVSAEVQDQGYDYRLKGSGMAHPKLLRMLGDLLVRTEGRSRPFKWSANLCLRLLSARGCPIDQTKGAALAQIQIVARKRSRAPLT
jgi:SAM-dependent methyltransferase